jgi:ubiquitin-protein ligase
MSGILFKDRIKKELDEARKRNTPDRTVTPLKEDDLSVWRGYVKSLDGSLHTFDIRLGNFPTAPPTIEWLTPIIHPNIEPPRSGSPEDQGRVCLPELTQPEKWNPKITIRSIVDHMVFLLRNPNPANPLMNTQCLREAIRMIREKARDEQQADLVGQLDQLLNKAEQALVRRDNSTAWQLVCDAGTKAYHRQKGQ